LFFNVQCTYMCGMVQPPAVLFNRRETVKEAEMEIRVSLNAIAAITSFAFLAAIVLGMV
jgi:hypothetical protein